jgi:hypothetical protein
MLDLKHQYVVINYYGDINHEWVGSIVTPFATKKNNYHTEYGDLYTCKLVKASSDAIAREERDNGYVRLYKTELREHCMFHIGGEHEHNR